MINWERHDARRRRRPGLNDAQVALASLTAVHTVLALGVLTALAWGVTYASGGSQRAVVCLFYLPVLLAAHRCATRCALAVATTMGVVAGPLLPFDVAAGQPAPAADWLIRLASYVFLSVLVAVLSHQSIEVVRRQSRLAARRTQLEAANDRGEFRAQYQPLFDLQTGRLTGVEALMRWHRDGEVVAPADFIADAEETGAIIAMGETILRDAAERTVRWRARVPDADFKVSVNLSATQLAQPTLALRVAHILEDTGLPPEALQLEITETALIDDMPAAVGRIDQLRHLGVGVAIDDFGTGQSSLAYLHRFRADVIKVDRSFVAALDDRHAAAVAAAITRLAQSLGATTVAEGIETEHQAQQLRLLGCEIGQGFLYARPSEPSYIDRILSLANVESRRVTPTRRSGIDLRSDPFPGAHQGQGAS